MAVPSLQSAPARLLVSGLACASFACSACSAEEGRTRALEAVVRDSAGIEIVESPTPLWEEGEGWRVDSVPTLQIGLLEGADPYLFGAIAAAVRFPDGRIALVETQSLEVRVFGPDGVHLATFGREGGGPGEFATTPRIVAVAPDTLLTWDARSRRWSWWHLEGALVRESTLPRGGRDEDVGRGTAVTTWAVFPDGTLFAADNVPRDDETRPSGETITTQFRFSFIRNQGADTVDIGRFGSRRTHFAVRGSAQDPFFPRTQIALQSDPVALHTSGPGAWAVYRWEADGNLSRIVRAAIPRVAVTEEMIRQHIDSVEAQRMRSRASEEQVEIRVRATEAVPYPDSAAAIDFLRIDTESRLWVLRWRQLYPVDAPVYDVIDGDGRWLGRVALPETLGNVLEIGGEYVLAEWKDELDVSYLRMYPIVEGGGDEG